MNKMRKILLSTILVGGLAISPVLNATEVEKTMDFSDANSFKVTKITDEQTPSNSGIALQIKTKKNVATGVSGKLISTGEVPIAMENFREVSGDCNKANYDSAGAPANATSLEADKSYCYFMAGDGYSKITFSIGEDVHVEYDITNERFDEKYDMTGKSTLLTELDSSLKDKYAGSIKLKKSDREGASADQYDIYFDKTKDATGSMIISDATGYRLMGSTYLLDGTNLDTSTNIMEWIESDLSVIYYDPTVETEIEKEMLEFVKVFDYDIYVTDFATYSSYMLGSNVENTDPIKLGVKLDGTTNQKTIETLVVDRSKAMFIELAHNGVLPKETEYTISVEDKFKDGDILTLYYYNPTTKKLELVAKDLKVESSAVSFKLDHASEYVLTKASNNAQTSSLNVVFYVTLAAISLAGVAIVVKGRKAE